MTERLGMDDFAAHIGTDFAISVDGHDERLTLVEVKPLKEGQSPSGVQGYVLTFHGNRTDALFHQQLFAMQHAEMGELHIFAVPIGKTEQGCFRYEAIFN